MKLLMENFRHFIIEEKINTYIKNTNSLTEKQLKEFIIKEYAKKNIVLSEQQLNEIMSKWLKALGAKVAMLGTVGSIAMGSAAQAGEISNVPIVDKDGNDITYTLSADELRSLSDAVESLSDEEVALEPGEKDIRTIAPSLDKIADHPTADVDYNNLTSGELMSTLELWAQAAYDNSIEAGGDNGAEDAPQRSGEIVDNGDGTFSLTISYEVKSGQELAKRMATNRAVNQLKGELGQLSNYNVTDINMSGNTMLVTVTATPAG